MTFQDFERMIVQMHKSDLNTTKLYELGVDIAETNSPLLMVIEKLLYAYFGAKGADWITWYCYENEYGTGNLKAWDENDQPICHTLQSLYEVIMEARDKQFAQTNGKSE